MIYTIEDLKDNLDLFKQMIFTFEKIPSDFGSKINTATPIKFVSYEKLEENKLKLSFSKLNYLLDGFYIILDLSNPTLKDDFIFTVLGFRNNKKLAEKLTTTSLMVKNEKPQYSPKYAIFSICNMIYKLTPAYLGILCLFFIAVIFIYLQSPSKEVRELLVSLTICIVSSGVLIHIGKDILYYLMVNTKDDFNMDDYIPYSKENTKRRFNLYDVTHNFDTFKECFIVFPNEDISKLNPKLKSNKLYQVHSIKDVKDSESEVELTLTNGNFIYTKVKIILDTKDIITTENIDFIITSKKSFNYILNSLVLYNSEYLKIDSVEKYPSIVMTELKYLLYIFNSILLKYLPLVALCLIILRLLHSPLGYTIYPVLSIGIKVWFIVCTSEIIFTFIYNKRNLSKRP